MTELVYFVARLISKGYEMSKIHHMFDFCVGDEFPKRKMVAPQYVVLGFLKNWGHPECPVAKHL